MVNKRQFLKTALVAGLTAPQLAFEASARDQVESAKGPKQGKHWVWVNPRRNDQETDVKRILNRGE